MRFLPPIAMLIATVVWRFGVAWQTLGFVVSGVALLSAWIIAGRRPRGDARLLCGLAGAAALLAASKGFGWWGTCDVGCQGAGAYRHLFGISVAWLAVLPLLGIAVAAVIWARRESETARQTAALLSWASAGCSAYFLLLLIELRIVCPHCLATHTIILALPAYTLRPGTGLNWVARLALGALGMAALHWSYHPGAGLANAHLRKEDPIGSLDEQDLRMLIAADHGRRLGQADAPLRATLVLDMACPHCREAVPKLLAALDPAMQEGRLQIIVRLRYAPAVASSKRLALLAMAAAAAKQHRAYLSAMLGTRATRDEQVDKRLPDSLASLGPLVDDYQRPFEKLLRLDRSLLSQQNARTGPTPQLILQQGPREIGRWQGELPLDAILASISSEP